jgi:hypothetical protein
MQAPRHMTAAWDRTGKRRSARVFFALVAREAIAAVGAVVDLVAPFDVALEGDGFATCSFGRCVPLDRSSGAVGWSGVRIHVVGGAGGCGAIAFSNG